MRVLSLFDGIACGRLALDRAGISVSRYDAYEIDQNAIKVAKTNYPDINECGDVFTAEYNDGEYDLLIGGSPCTYWSVAQTHREITPDGVGGQLFEQYVRALHTVNPRNFLYENNVGMSPNIKEYITTRLGVEPVKIDSSMFSATAGLLML